MNNNNYFSNYKNLIFLIILTFVIFLFLKIFIIKNESWYHIESLMSFVNSNQNTKISYWEIIFKGTYFDDNPARFRPISHIIEYIDNYSKFFLFNITINNTILNTLSNYFFIFFSFYILFNIFKESGFSIISSLFLLLLTFSFTAFLGSFYFSFRPAKKIVLLLSFFAFLNFLKYKKNEETKYLYYSFLYNFLLLISDEEGWYLSFVFICFYLLEKNFLLNNFRREWLYINIISLISIVTYTIVWPRSYFDNLYREASVVQQSSTLIQFDKFKLYFNSILENFFSGFFGLSGKYSLIIPPFLLLIFIYFSFNSTFKSFIKKILIVIFLILGFVIFNTCLELIGGNIIMRSLGYYYGSSKIVLLFFIIFIFTKDFKIKKKLNKYIFLFYVVITIMIFYNIKNYLNINMLIKNIHFEKIQYQQFYYNFDISQKTRINKNCDFFLDNFKKYDEVSYKAENLTLLKKINISNKYNIDLLNNYSILTSVDNLQYFFDYLSGCKLLLKK